MGTLLHDAGGESVLDPHRTEVLGALLVRDLAHLAVKLMIPTMDDPGINTEHQWQKLIAVWERMANRDPQPNQASHLAVLIRLAARRPELGRLIPYTSLQYFSVSRKPYPFDWLPKIEALRDGSYALTSRKPKPLPDGTYAHAAIGTASAVLDALEEAVRELGPLPPTDEEGP